MEQNNTEKSIEELAIIAANDARILYCAMEIQKLTAVLRDSLSELQLVEKYY